MTETKPTNGLLTDRLNFTNNRRTKNRPICLTIVGSKPTNDWWQTNNSSFQNYTHPDDHTIRTTDTPGFKPFTISHESFSQYHHGLTDQLRSTDQTFQLTNTIHLTLKMTSPHVVQTSVTNNSSFQSYPHPDDHTIRTTDTPGFKPFTIILEKS